jgi:hypothetical protein
MLFSRRGLLSHMLTMMPNWRLMMRSFFAACCVIVILAVGSAVVLINDVQEPVVKAFSTSGVQY